MTPTTITISGAGSDLIERLQAGYESRELIDLFGMKLTGVKFSSHIWEGEARGTMIAREVTAAQPVRAPDHKERVSGWATGIDWSKAPEGATHYFAPFFYKAGSKRAYLFDSFWEPSAYNISQIDSLGTKRPTAAQPWSCDGLPPVGTRCEARIPHHTASGLQMLWCEVEILAHAIVQGAECSWCKEPGADGGFYAPMMLTFRPIKTPAQIAAEEREAFARTLVFEMGKDPDSSPNSITQGRRMYDLGYRRAIADT